MWLPSIDLTTKLAFRITIRHLFRAALKAEIFYRNWRRLVGLSCLVSLMVAIGWLFSSIFFKSRNHAPLITLLGAVIFLVFIFALIYFRIQLKSALYIPSLAVIALYISTSPLWHAEFTHANWIKNLNAFFWGGSVLSLVMFGTIYGLALPIEIMLAKSRTRVMDSWVFDSLVEILFLIERKPADWYDLSFRVELIKKLDKVGNDIQRYLPAVCKSGDGDFDSWMSDRAWRTGAYLREMKKWIIVPREDTRAYLIGQIATIIVCIAKGDWDGIPTVPASQQSRREKHWVDAAAKIRVALASLLPSLLLCRFGQVSCHHSRLNEILCLPRFFRLAGCWSDRNSRSALCCEDRRRKIRDAIPGSEQGQRLMLCHAFIGPNWNP